MLIFANQVIKEVQPLYPDLKFSPCEVWKNDEKCLAISWGKDGDNSCPSVPVKKLYSIFLHEGFSELIKWFSNLINNNASLSFDVKSLVAWDTILDNVIPALCRGPVDTEILSRRLDGTNLCIYYRVLCEQEAFGLGTFVVSKTISKKVELTEKELYHAAIRNMKCMTVVSSLSEVCKQMGGRSIPDLSDFNDNLFRIVSNTKGIYGAGCMLNTEILDEIASGYGMESVVILPSSKHEIIVVPYSGSEDFLEDVYEMVKMVNYECVGEEDFLADDVYLYSSNDKSFTSYSNMMSLSSCASVGC